MKEFVLKNIRKINLILFLSILGIILFYQLKDGWIPIAITISSIVIVTLINVFTLIYEERLNHYEKVEKYGKHFWIGPHLIINFIIGCLFILFDIFLETTGKYILGYQFVIGFIIGFQSLISIRNYYIKLTEKYIIKDSFFYWKYSKIKKMELQDDKITLEYGNSMNIIYLGKIERPRRQDLINKLKRKIG